MVVLSACGKRLATGAAPPSKLASAKPDRDSDADPRRRADRLERRRIASADNAGFMWPLPISSGSPPSDAFLSLPGRVVTSAGQGNYWYDAFVSRWLQSHRTMSRPTGAVRPH